MEVKLGYKQTEVGMIPEDWEVKTLGKFVALRRGHDLTERERRRGNVPVMGSAGPSGFHDIALVRGPGVVLGRSGASFGQAHYCASDFWPHNTALYVTDFLGNDPLFSFHFLKSIDFRRHNSGGAQQSLNRNFIAPIVVALPKRSEQEIIAAALSHADLLIETLERLITKKRHLRQGAMQELLTGHKRLPGFNEEWKVKQLGDIAACYSGGTPPTGVAAYYDGDISWITSGDLNQGYIRHVNGRISRSGLEHSAAKIVTENTLLMALYGATAGVTAITGLRAAINQAVLAIIPHSDDVLFLYFTLRHLQSWLVTTYTQGGQPNLSAEIVKSIELRVPARTEQGAIASILSDMDGEIAALEARLAKTRLIKQGMMQELLTGKVRLV